MTTQAQVAAFPGTLPELLVYNALIELGKVEGIDFTFQSSLLGGRQERGGLIIDFLISPDLAISVLGTYFHYFLGGGTGGNDLLTREILAKQGTTLIFIDEHDLVFGEENTWPRNARYYVSEALQYRDHSDMTTGGSPPR